MLPIRSAQLVLIGTSFATGLPRLVITMPSGPTRSTSAKHCSLNLVTLMVFMTILYDQSEKLSSSPV